MRKNRRRADRRRGSTIPKDLGKTPPSLLAIMRSRPSPSFRGVCRLARPRATYHDCIEYVRFTRKRCSSYVRSDDSIKIKLCRDLGVDWGDLGVDSPELFAYLASEVRINVVVRAADLVAEENDRLRKEIEALRGGASSRTAPAWDRAPTRD